MVLLGTAQLDSQVPQGSQETEATLALTEQKAMSDLKVMKGKLVTLAMIT